MRVRYCESTIRRSNSCQRGSVLCERSIAAPELQKSIHIVSAAETTPSTSSSRAGGAEGAEPAGHDQRRDNAYGELVVVRMARGQDPDWLAIECELTDHASLPEIQLLAYIRQIRKLRFLTVSSTQHHPDPSQVQSAR